MPDLHDRLPSRRDARAKTRQMAALAASLALVNALFLLWPASEAGGGLGGEISSREQVTLELIEQTTQIARQPAPPPPPPPPPPDLAPVEVPDDKIIEEVVEEIPLPVLPDLPVAVAPSGGPVGSGPPPPVQTPPPPPPPPVQDPPPPPPSDRIVENPDRRPRQRGLAFAVYPESERRSGFRGRARVRVLISPGGQVTEAEIVERYEIDGDRETPVASFAPAFDAAVLEAARRALFSAARQGGERVRAYAFLTVSLDPPR